MGEKGGGGGRGGNASTGNTSPAVEPAGACSVVGEGKVAQKVAVVALVLRRCPSAWPSALPLWTAKTHSATRLSARPLTEPGCPCSSASCLARERRKCTLSVARPP